jgi:hypothetical protein
VTRLPPKRRRVARIARRRLKELEEAVEASGISVNTWRRRGERAAGALETLRRELRYPLQGTNEGMRVLTRLPSWTGHRQGSDEGEVLLGAANAVAQALHLAIAYSWRAGRPPSRRHVKRIDAAVRKLTSVAPVGVPREL